MQSDGFQNILMFKDDLKLSSYASTKLRKEVCCRVFVLTVIIILILILIIIITAKITFQLN